MNIVITGDSYSNKYDVAYELSKKTNIPVAKLIIYGDIQSTEIQIPSIITYHQKSFAELKNKFKCKYQYIENGQTYAIELVDYINNNYITVCGKTVAEMYFLQEHANTVIFSINPDMLCSIKTLYNSLYSSQDDEYIKNRLKDFIQYKSSKVLPCLYDSEKYNINCSSVNEAVKQIEKYIKIWR